MLTLHWWMEPVYFFALMTPFGIGIHFLNRWYVNKLYGRHVKKLQHLLQEMDEV
jgi:hypothetical protein